MEENEYIHFLLYFKHNYTKITSKITQHGKIQLVLTLALKHYPFKATL